MHLKDRWSQGVLAGAFLLVGAAFFLRNSGWMGNADLHTDMEIVAATLAAVVGMLSLVRFYSQKNNTVLFIGVAFLGSAFLDGYHAIVTAEIFPVHFPSAPVSLIPWSWLASRLYLSVLLFLSWVVWRRERARGGPYLLSEKKIYFAAGAVTIGFFLFFGFASLPRIMFPEWMVARPEEFLPGAIFLAAAIGYFQKRSWESDQLEFCLLTSTLAHFAVQIFFMVFSAQLFDAMFNAAHLLKIGAYTIVLAGLMVDMYRMYWRAEHAREEISGSMQQLESLTLAAEEISRHLDLDSLLEIVASQSKKLFSPDRIGVLLFDSDREIWKWYYTWGLSRSYQKQLLRVWASAPGKYAEERQTPIFVENALTDPRAASIRGLVEREGYVSMAVLPLRREGKAGGTLTFYYNMPRIFSAEEKTLCRAFGEHSSTVLHNALLLLETRREAERQVALKEVSQQLGQILKLDEIASAIIRASVQLLGADCAQISLRQEIGDSQRPKSFYADTAWGVENIGWFLSEELERGILGSGQPLLIPDASADRRVSHLGWAAELGMQSYLGVPIVVEGKGAGILQCMSKDGNKFSRADISLLQSLGSISAFAIRNAILFEEAQDRIAEVNEMAEATAMLASGFGLKDVLQSIAKTGTRLLGMDRAFIAISRGETDFPEIAYVDGISESHLGHLKENFGKSMFKKVISGERKLVVFKNVLNDPDYVMPLSIPQKEGFRGLVMAPLEYKNEILGALCFYWTEPQKFLAGQLALIRTFASQAAIAIEKARLHEEAQSRISVLESLQEAAKNLTTEVDLKELLNRLTGVSRNLLGTEHCVVVLEPEENEAYPEFYFTDQIPESYRKRLHDNYPDSHLHSVAAGQIERFVSGDMSQDTNIRFRRQIPEEEGFYAVLITPLISQGRPFGAFCVFWGSPQKFTSSEIPLTETLASYLAAAVRNVKLHAAARSRIEELESFYGAAQSLTEKLEIEQLLRHISESSISLLGADRCFVSVQSLPGANPEILYSKGITERHLKRLKENYPESLLSKVTMGKIESYSSGDILAETEEVFSKQIAIREGIRALVVNPLVYQGKRIGALGLYWNQARQLKSSEIRLAQAFSHQAAIAIENASLFQKSETRAARLDALNKMGQMVVGEVGFADMLQNVAATAVNMFETDAVLIYLKNEKTGELEMLSFHSLVHTPGGYGHKNVLSPNSIGGWVVQTGRPVIISNVQEEPKWQEKEWAEEQGIHSFMAQPLRRGANVIGIINCMSKKEGYFGIEDLGLLSTFASQVAILAENIRLHESAQSRIAELESVQEVVKDLTSDLGLGEIMSRIEKASSRLMGNFRCHLVARDEKTHEPVYAYVSEKLPPGYAQWLEDNFEDTVMGKVFLGEVERVVIGDVADEPWMASNQPGAPQDFRAVMICPMIHQGVVFGTLGFHWSEPQTFTDSDVSLAQTFADQAAVAIRNARVLEETKARVAELESLQKAAEAVTSVRELNELTRQVAEATMEMLHATRYTVTIYRQETDEVEFQFKGLAQDFMDVMRENFDRTILKSALESQDTMKVEDVFEDERIIFFKETFDKEGFRSFLVNPFIYQGKALGGLTVYWDEPRKITDAEISLARTFGDQAAVAIQNATLHDQAQSYIAALEKMQDAAKELTTEHHMTDVFLKIEESTADLLGAMCLHVFTKEAEGNAHFFYKSKSITQSHIRFLEENFSKTVVARIFSGHEDPVAVGDTRSSPDYPFPEEVGREMMNFGALLSCPLVYRGETFGAITFHWKEPRVFRPHETALAQTFADQAAVAIQNATLFQRTKDYASRMAALNELSLGISENLELRDVLDRVATAAAKLTEAEVARIVQLNRSTGRYDLAATSAEEKTQVGIISFAPGEGLSGSVAASKKGVLIPDVHEDPRWARTYLPWEKEMHSYVGAPGMQDGETILVINCFSKEKNFFDREDLELLEALAAQGTIAVQNASLYEDITRRAREIEVSEARFRTVVQSAQDGVIAIDQKGEIILFNEAAEKMFGYREEEIRGKNVKILMPSPFREEHDGYLEAYLRTAEPKAIGVVRMLQGRRKNGEIFPLELSVGEVNVEGAHFYTGIVRDITERFEIDRMKSEFVSVVSHEIRTPLTSLRGSLGLLESGVAGEVRAEGKDLLRIAVSNTDRLIRLINDILDLEKIESGTMELVIEKHSLSEIVEKALAEMQGTMENYGVELKTELTPCDVEVDSDTIVQVLTNLLSNAAKFSEPGQTVTVKSWIMENSAQVSVVDRGRGIPPEKIDAIFERFQQADSSDSRAKGGTGLGLTICQSIVEKHGGKIWVESKLGEGSTFYFSIPLPETRKSIRKDNGFDAHPTKVTDSRL